MGPGSRAPPPNVRGLGVRGFVLLGIALLGVWAFSVIDIGLAEGVTFGDATSKLSSFFSHALTPALHYEGNDLGADQPGLIGRALDGARLTLIFAAAAMSLAIPAGLALGFVASTSWWTDDPGRGSSAGRKWLRRAGAPALYLVARTVIGVMRSIHELIWATLFLAALGLSNTSAVIAIAIPYAGTLAKVFSEMLDEAPRDTCVALQGAGAGPVQVFVFGLLPRAVPDLAAYTLYRFECALRSSAILGFFGWPTLGLYIHQSWDSGHFSSVWTYLYVLIAMVVAADMWSSAVRKRLVA